MTKYKYLAVIFPWFWSDISIICELNGTRIVSPCVSMGKMSRLGTPLILFRTMFHFMIVLSGILQQLLEKFSEPCQISKMELSGKIVNSINPLMSEGNKRSFIFKQAC